MALRVAILTLLAAIVLGACSDDQQETPTIRAVKPAPTATLVPTPEPSPTPTATPQPTSTPTPMPAFSLDVTQDTTWQEAFDAFTPSEQDCIRDAVDDDELAAFLRMPVASDDGVFEESGPSVLACLDLDTANHLFVSGLLVGMAHDEGITPSEGDRACLQERLSGVDVAELLANDEAAGQRMFGAMMRCLPHVMMLSLAAPPGAGAEAPLGVEVEVDEDAQGCLREWAADIDWETQIFSEGLALFGPSTLACRPARPTSSSPSSWSSTGQGWRS